jgi:hypothetical protein
MAHFVANRCHTRAKLEVFDWLVERKDKRLAKSPAGYLVKSIADDYATPKGFISRAQREAQAEAKRQAEQRAADARRHEHEHQTRERAMTRKVTAYLKQLDQAQRIALEAEALSAASPEARANYESHVMAKFRDTLMLAMLRDYLGSPHETEDKAR